MENKIYKNIKELKEKNDAVVLAHSYQSLEIQDMADIKGDSFYLADKATKLKQQNIYMCGVRFMAESIKLLSPQKNVYLVNERATCPMAEQISPSVLVEYKLKNKDHKIVSYINTTAQIKAVSDVCVTSSSAIKIVKALKEKDILFIPDKNLGRYVQENVKDKRFHFLDGFCPVHNQVTLEETLELKKKYKDYKLLCHPELPYEICKIADYVGSTSGILEYARENKNANCIIGTETTILKTLQSEFKDRDFVALSKNLICHDMAITTINDLYKALKGERGEEIIIDKSIEKNARKPIEEMIKLQKK